VSPVWWVVLAGLLLLAVVIAVTGYLRLRWLQSEELRAYAAEEPEPGVVTVTLTIDTRGFVEAMQRASRATWPPGSPSCPLTSHGSPRR
jgi:uncharacterized protein (DUF58 family)